MNLINKIKNYLFEINPEKFFVIIGLSFGLFYVFLTPIFQGPDEPVHFFSIARYSNGYMNINKENGTVGVRAQPGIFEIYKFNPDLRNQAKYDYKKQVSTLIKLKLGTYRGMYSTVNRGAPYNPLAYSQYIVAYTISSVFQLGPFYLFIFIRLIGLLTWLVLVYFAIKTIPKGKWLLASIALLPMSLFIASMISADNLTNGLLFVFIALIFKVIYTPKYLTKKYLLGLIALAVVVGLTKQTYFLASLLLFALPRPNFIQKKYFYITLLITVLATTFLAVGWQVLIGNWSISPIVGVSTSGQVHHIISRPLSFVKTIFNTIVTSNSNGLYISFFGVLGWLDVTLPFWVIFGWLVVLIKSIGIKTLKAKYYFKIWQKLIFVTVSLLLFGALILGLYLTWTPVGDGIINGLQGRYIIPIFAILIPVIASRRSEPDNKVRVFTVSGIVLLEIATLIVFLFRYMHIY